jgi:probable phosphoglycerate mutase
MTRRLVVLVRHAAYREDPEELTHAGREQTRLTARRLADLAGGQAIDRIVHAPTARAAQTAATLAGFLDTTAVEVDDLLAECIPAVPADELLTEQQRAVFARVSASDRAAGASQAAAARDRFLTPPAAGDADRVDLLVSHGNLIRWLVTTVIGAEDGAWFQLVDYHCAISTIALRAKRPPALIAFNDTGHLPAALRGDEYPAELRW